MATIEKRGPGQWRAKVRKKGFPVQTQTFGSRAEAEAWARDIESQMDRSTFIDPAAAKRTTVADLIEFYRNERLPGLSSQKQTASDLNRLCSDLGHYIYADINPPLLCQWRDRQLKTLSNDTVRKRLGVLKRVFDHARKRHRIVHPDDKLMSDVDLPSLGVERSRRLVEDDEDSTKNEYNRLLKALERTVVKDLFVFLVETALRRGEALALCWRHVDFKRNTIRVEAVEQGARKSRPRHVPLTPAARALLESIKESNSPILDSDRIFPIARDSVTQAFRRACKRANIKGLRIHDLRHEATSRFFEDHDLAIVEVASITGHTDTKSLARYTHLAAAKLAKKLKKNAS